MKGTIKLVPIENPKEGMKVIWGDGQLNHLTIDEILKIGVEHNGFKNLVSLKRMFLLPFSISELQQLVVEYDNSPPPAQFYASGIKPSKGVSILPLHPNDWEKGITLIGKEIEFETPYPFEIAHLIINTPIIYTEEEVEKLTRKAFHSNDKMHSDWWDQNKKK